MHQSPFTFLNSLTQRSYLPLSQFTNHLLHYAPLCSDQASIYSLMLSTQLAFINPIFYLNQFQLAKNQRVLQQAYTYLLYAKKLDAQDMAYYQTIETEQRLFIEMLKEALLCCGPSYDWDLKELIYYDKFEMEGIDDMYVDQGVDDEIKDTLIYRLIIEYNKYCGQERQIAVEIYQREMASRPMSWFANDMVKAEEFLYAYSHYPIMSSPNHTPPQHSSPHPPEQMSPRPPSRFNRQTSDNIYLSQTPFISSPHQQTPPQRQPQHGYLRQSSIKVLRRTSWIGNNQESTEQGSPEHFMQEEWGSPEQFRSAMVDEQPKMDPYDFTFGKKKKPMFCSPSPDRMRMKVRRGHSTEKKREENEEVDRTPLFKFVYSQGIQEEDEENEKEEEKVGMMVEEEEENEG